MKESPHSQVYLGTQGSHSSFYCIPVLKITANQSEDRHFYCFSLTVGEVFTVHIEASPQVVLSKAEGQAGIARILLRWQFRGIVGLWVIEN